MLNISQAPASSRTPLRVLAFATAVLLTGGQAFAYIGPGLGLGFIGVLVGVAAAVVLTLFGIVYYPLKRLFGKKPAAVEKAEQVDEADLSQAADDPAE